MTIAYTWQFDSLDVFPTYQTVKNMKIYKKALRDVPTQEGFPWNITWPVEP
jgi:hypothetical protein